MQSVLPKTLPCTPAALLLENLPEVITLKEIAESGQTALGASEFL